MVARIKENLPRGEFGEVRLVDEAKVQTDFAARDRTVERRGAMKEVDLKPQLLLEKYGARRHVSNEQYWDDGLQSDFGH
jgi:hypothetical protein